MSDSHRRIDEEVDELEALLQPGRESDLETFLALLHPADVADLIEHLNEETAVAILQHIDPERSGELLSELEPDEQERVLNLIRPQQVAEIVGEMETDDITDLLQELPAERAKELLAILPLEEREDVTELLAYDRESAGGIMQTELVSVTEDATVGQALDAVRANADEFDIFSVFVVDDKKRYLGNIALQSLVLAQPETPVEAVMDPKIVDVTTDIDQEEVAQIFDKYSLHELAVLDRVGRLRGRITADDVHEVLVEEAEEDLMLIAGTAADEPELVYSDHIWRIAGVRLPWLFATFFGGLVATYILHSTDAVFGTVVVLLTFVPIITGMSGNVGTQSAMIMIRGLAVGHIEEDELKHAVMRDFLVGFIIAVACGFAVFAVVAVWHRHLMLGACIGVSLGGSMVTAAVLGSIEPVVLKRFGIDPAIAAGPLITSINDITGVAIYALVSARFLEYLI